MLAKPTVSIVGGGPVGAMLSIFLAKRGFPVEIFERRPDMRREAISGGRSINLALSVRGLHGLRAIGLEKQALSEAVPMFGRMMHSLGGELTFQPYGKEDTDCIYSMSRGGLNKMLMTAAEATGRVSIDFRWRAERIAEDGGVILKNDKTGAARKTTSDLVFGTDGSASVIRNEIAERSGGTVTQSYLNYGYKELQLPAGPGGQHLLAKNALHIWPRGTFMLIALPNFDGSFTCTLFLPFDGEVSFERLLTKNQVEKFFSEQFPDVTPLFPSLSEEFFANPTGRMVTVKCRPWQMRGRTLLLGDAAHAIVPFFGQGLNCGFEDCTVLDEMIGQEADWVGADGPVDWRKLFDRFEESRRPNADAIADMAAENFVEMRDKVADPRFLLEKQVERVLQREFPDRYVSRYSLVTFSRVPYLQALRAGVIHSEILGELCRSIGAADEVNRGLADRLIREKLDPLWEADAR